MEEQRQTTNAWKQLYYNKVEELTACQRSICKMRKAAVDILDITSSFPNLDAMQIRGHVKTILKG